VAHSGAGSGYSPDLVTGSAEEPVTKLVTNDTSASSPEALEPAVTNPEPGEVRPDWPSKDILELWEGLGGPLIVLADGREIENLRDYLPQATPVELAEICRKLDEVVTEMFGRVANRSRDNDGTERI